jgi:hypothetical protein
MSTSTPLEPVNVTVSLVEGKLDAKINDGQEAKINAIAAAMAGPTGAPSSEKKDDGAASGGSSKGGKSRRNRKSKGVKSRKGRKSLRRK